jgi:hypothetical protein
MSSSYREDATCPVCGIDEARLDVNSDHETEISCPRCGFFYRSEIAVHQGVTFWHTKEWRPMRADGYLASAHEANGGRDEGSLPAWNAKEFGTLNTWEEIPKVFGAQDAAGYEALTDPKPVKPLNPVHFDEVDDLFKVDGEIL